VATILAIWHGARLTNRGARLGECADFFGVDGDPIRNGHRGIWAEMAGKPAAAMGTRPELRVNLRRGDDLTNAAEPDFGRLGA
jgi:hypothetical protein